jgi:hypothetical protein
MEEYGKSPENPIVLSSITSSTQYLNSLVTLDGMNILYHRQGSLSKNSKIIDHYEIIDGHGDYDDIYVDVYGDVDRFVPPSGYMFTRSIRFAAMYGTPPDDAYIIGRAACADEKKLQHYLSKSSGTNYFVDDFPYSLFDMDKDRIFKTFSKRVDVGI